MKNKYLAFSILSIKNLVINSSLLLGFGINLLLMILLVLYLLVFQSEINPIEIIKFTTNDFFVNKIILIGIIIILFNGVSLVMQDIMQDRDSKVSEIVNTSVHEKHYIFGKIVAGFTFMIIFVLEIIVSFVIAFTIFTVFTDTGFNILDSVIVPLLKWISVVDNFSLLITILLSVLILMIGCLVLTLALSVKVAKLAEAPSVALLVLLPYITISFLIFIIPSSDMDLWNSIIKVGMYTPIVSGLFIISDIIMQGITLVNTLAIVLSIIFLLILSRGTVNIYKYAFYLRANFKYKEMISMACGRNNYG